MKLKHNKLRNTGLLFEMLVRQITADTLKNKESEAIGIIKKYFRNTQLSKEYGLYRTISEAKGLSETKANAILEIALESYKKLNKQALRKQKYDLVAAIKEHYNLEDFFKTKIENYKTLASVYLMFEARDSQDLKPETEAKYRFSLMEGMCHQSTSPDKEDPLEEYRKMDKGTKSLVYKLMVEEFNKTYSGLDQRQKELISKYITSVSSSDDFRGYVNKQMLLVEREIKAAIKKETNPVRKVKLEEVSLFIQKVPEGKTVCDKDVHNLLHYFELIKELGSNEK